MKPIRVVAMGNAEPRFLDAARAALAAEYGAAMTYTRRRVDPAFALHPERKQYHSTEILEQLARLDDDGTVILAVGDVDLYIPILTFVFGEAHLGGRCAVVSYHRLLQEFYGLPRDDRLAATRLAKTAVHETGHVFGLTHCDDYECVMAASHSVEWMDLKGAELCEQCRCKITVSSQLSDGA
ncbi:MAG TPA: archaemetzincin family Zn-dependent metalloprotease [Thermoanaerobaculia bacterium]|nr:archaemetzincin family Zn-dependent metalloprotease [Thermoanaerobaculia bacterium]